MKELFKFGFVLGLICLLATAVLAVTYEFTKPKIEEQLKAEEQNALRILLPGADTFVEKYIQDIEYFEGIKSGNIVGYCVRVTGVGYSGYIRILVGIDKAGIINGVKILEHYETPGMGAKINEIRPGDKEAWFLKQFKGKPAKEIVLNKDIDAVTGATISSKAVVDAIKSTASKFLSQVKK